MNYETMTQKQRALAYLETHKGMTPLDAWQKLGIYRISDVIMKLRRDGHRIETHDTKVKNRFNEKCRVAEYRLER